MNAAQRRVDAEQALAGSDVIHDRASVEQAIDRLALDVADHLAETNPVVLCVMNGGLPFTAALLERLDFALELDYLHATRFRGIEGGAITWKAFPELSLAGRHVLVVDDVLDAGITLHAVLERVAAAGAASVRSAVLVDKQLASDVLRADHVALTCPDRYLFGWGMDYHGYWRNRRDIRALAPAPAVAGA